jgi:hypothetical protein
VFDYVTLHPNTGSVELQPSPRGRSLALSPLHSLPSSLNHHLAGGAGCAQDVTTADMLSLVKTERDGVMYYEWDLAISPKECAKEQLLIQGLCFPDTVRTCPPHTVHLRVGSCHFSQRVRQRAASYPGLCFPYTVRPLPH